MLEKDIENLIAKYPDEFFTNSGFKLVGQQVRLGKCYVDIVFSDKYNRAILLEIKRGILSREAAGQALDYYGLLKQEKPSEIIELILCANTIPHERSEFLERYGIECKELGIAKIIEVARKYDYRFLDEKELEKPTNSEPQHKEDIKTVVHPVSDGYNVWIFQANPNRYDLLNAFSDPNIGDSIHWLVQQHRDKIKKGHTGLIWLSGKESGIYAVTEIISDPAVLLEPAEEDQYWMENKDRNVPRLRVKMRITRKLLNSPIFRSQLLKTKGMESLSILRYRQGTNFPVSKSEWEILSKLIYG